MMRDCLLGEDYWNHSIEFELAAMAKSIEILGGRAKNVAYMPQYAKDIAFDHVKVILRCYSRGDPKADLSQYLEPLLHYWEESERLGMDVWTPEQRYRRHTWSINLDHYIDCFWLIGLALAFQISDEQWQRLLNLIGNEGEDLLLDRIISTRSPSRKIGISLCYPKPYTLLLKVIDAPREKQAVLLNRFVEHWYEEVGNAAKSARQSQAVPYTSPYWHNYHQINGAYFGYWCLEAVAAVKAFNLDDSLCVGHPHYPGDLLRPEQVTAPDMSRLLPELAATIGAPPEPPFTGEPVHLTKWEALKMLVKNKLTS